LKRLVSGDRLKKFSADRTDLNARLPLLSDGQTFNSGDADAGQASTTTDFTTPDPVPMGYDPAIRILKEETRNRSKEYYVLFQNKTRH